VVWLTVNSGAKGKQGYMDGPAAEAFVKESGAKPTAYLLDADGAVGKAYGARTTPHMYVIDGQGVLRYAGGIDSVQSADQDDIKGATQYVRQALTELSSGRPVSVATSQPVRLLGEVRVVVCGKRIREPHAGHPQDGRHHSSQPARRFPTRHSDHFRCRQLRDPATLGP
jgi:hypothetical protein